MSKTPRGSLDIETETILASVCERIEQILSEQSGLSYLKYEIARELNEWTCWIVPHLGPPFKYLTATLHQDPMSGKWIQYDLGHPQEDL